MPCTPNHLFLSQRCPVYFSSIDKFQAICNVVNRKCTKLTKILEEKMKITKRTVTGEYCVKIYNNQHKKTFIYSPKTHIGACLL